jgi:hypothetical protein
MGIITKEVEVKLQRCGNRYLQMGYDVPMKEVVDKHGNKKFKFDFSKTIKVKIEDLTERSSVPIEVECDFCGKHYTISKDALHSHTSFTEGGLILCEHCAKTKYFVGKKACRYDKNKTDEEREKIRYNLEYVNMLKRIRIRDDNKCIVCSSKLNLVVHHLNGYTDFVDERCDDDNCVLLCENCHKNFHHFYGYFHNTKEQFEEWLGETLKIKTDKNKKLEETRKIYCYETDKIYDSSFICAVELGFKKKSTHKSIYSCCYNRKNSISYKGLHFAFAEDVENLSYEEKITHLMNIILKIDTNKTSFIDLDTGVIYFSSLSCMKYTNFDKHYRLTNLKFKNKNILNNHYRFIPYYKFISFDKETQKKLCDKHIKLFNILEYESIS